MKHGNIILALCFVEALTNIRLAFLHQDNPVMVTYLLIISILIVFVPLRFLNKYKETKGDETE